jgi:hypothetical protein
MLSNRNIFSVQGVLSEVFPVSITGPHDGDLYKKKKLGTARC